MTATAAARKFAPNDYEARVIDFARRCLDDIPECAGAEYRVRWLDNVPTLWLCFCPPQILVSKLYPACQLRLKTQSISNPINGGQLLDVGDRLRGFIRRSIEEYMRRHGIRIEPFDPELGEFYRRKER